MFKRLQCVTNYSKQISHAIYNLNYWGNLSRNITKLNELDYSSSQRKRQYYFRKVVVAKNYFSQYTSFLSSCISGRRVMSDYLNKRIWMKWNEWSQTGPNRSSLLGHIIALHINLLHNDWRTTRWLEWTQMSFNDLKFFFERFYRTWTHVHVRYMSSSVRLSSVYNVRATYSADWNFQQCFCAI